MRGKWHLSRSKRFVMDRVGAPWICEVTQRPGWEEHARLLAAAPDLLAALEQAVPILDYFVHDRREFIGPGTPEGALSAARAALSLAHPPSNHTEESKP